MRTSISYPPIESPKGIPLLSQNRQFQWFNAPTYIYPMVPASAATLLEENQFNVSWDDGIAEGLTLTDYLERISQQQPDVILIETKTPVIKSQWKIVDELKQQIPQMKIVLAGDHVTALPQESLENSKADFVLTGGDYDFLLLNLCQHLSEGRSLEPGIWYRENGNIQNTGQFVLNHDLDSLPFIDRELTQWQLYSEKNGNYKRLPGTYIMAGRDCWWHKCSFCAWTNLYSGFRVRTPNKMLDEIEILVDKYGVKEIFDDTGSFPTGKWLDEFCQGLIDRGFNRRINFGCNMRFGTLDREQYQLMRKAGFRYVLFGLESANQKTLDRINKGIKVSDIVTGCEMAKKAGLEPHLTIMIGYPWESEEDIRNTINLAKSLFKKGYADSLQATVTVPYPGTPLFKECKDEGLLSTLDWDDYDMRRPVMKTSISEENIKQATQELYKVFFTPKYMLRRLQSIESFDDVRFVGRGVKKVFGHLKDFSKQDQLSNN